MKAFILAAGFGTRMQELTRGCPKPLLPVGGYPLIYYSLYWLYKWKVDACVINTHYLAEQIQERLKNFPHFPIHFSHEEEILGTAGGIRHAMPHCLGFDEQFLLLNPDTILLPTAKDDPRQLTLKKEAQDTFNLSHLYLAPRNDSEATAIQRLPSGQLAFTEDGPYFYPGFALIHGRLLADTPDLEFAALGPLWRRAARQQRLGGQLFHGQIIDAGTRSAYLSNRDSFPLPPESRSAWEKFLQGWHEPQPI